MRKVIQTGVFNRVGDEVVFFEGYSDWGVRGWFSGWKIEIKERTTRYSTYMFFENEKDMREEYEKVINGQTEGYI
jgi:hypothetical protein